LIMLCQWNVESSIACRGRVRSVYSLVNASFSTWCTQLEQPPLLEFIQQFVICMV
jgi:hypothetical protein